MKHLQIWFRISRPLTDIPLWGGNFDIFAAPQDSKFSVVPLCYNVSVNYQATKFSDFSRVLEIMTLIIGLHLIWGRKRRGMVRSWVGPIPYVFKILVYCILPLLQIYFYSMFFATTAETAEVYYCSLVSISFFKSMITTATHVRRYLVVTKSSPRVASTTSFTRGLTPVCWPAQVWEIYDA